MPEEAFVVGGVSSRATDCSTVTSGMTIMLATGNERFFIGAEFLVLTFFDTFLEDYNWVVSFVLLFFRLTWVSSLYYAYFFALGFISGIRGLSL